MVPHWVPDIEYKPSIFRYSPVCGRASRAAKWFGIFSDIAPTSLTRFEHTHATSQICDISCCHPYPKRGDILLSLMNES